MNTIGSSTRVNLGCGESRLPGFVNVDSRPSLVVDVICDMLSLPFDSNSLEIVYMCHSLEHIPLHDVQSFLVRVLAVLAPGGRLYISVPDFSVLAALYLSGRVDLATIVRAIHGGQEYPGNLHYMSYDYTLLTSMLLQAGFSSTEKYIPETFLPGGFYDTSMYEIAGRRISLNVVATKA